jgi:hypothetical protein
MQSLLENTYLVVFTIVAGAAICFSIVSFIMGHTKRHSGTGRLYRDWKGNRPMHPPEEFRTHAAECVSMPTMIQHDCGHGSFFRNRSANDWVGRVIGVLTLTPYDFWRRTHGIGPAYLFILKHRLPVGLLRAGWQPWLSTHDGEVHEQERSDADEPDQAGGDHRDREIRRHGARRYWQ